MPRPTVDEQLAAEIRRIHRQTHDGESAGSLQEALDTVVQLALEEAGIDGQSDEGDESWYPGKFAGQVVERVAGDDSGASRERPASSRHRSEAQSRHSPDRSPNQTAIFKARLNDDRTVRVPEAEAEALGFEAEDILQVYAYAVDE